MIRTLVILVAGLTLTACATTASTTNPDAGVQPDPMPEPQPCAAEAYQVLVGQPVGGVHTDSLPRPHRVYGPGDMITEDYRPDRLNIVVGENGVIAEVKCG